MNKSKNATLITALSLPTADSQADSQPDKQSEPLQLWSCLLNSDLGTETAKVQLSCPEILLKSLEICQIHICKVFQ